MFVDLVSSTPIADRIDPEEYLEILKRFHRACSDAIESHEGHVARYVGDGVFAYFGYPTAHEDDARRAVDAGLDIVRTAPGVVDDRGEPLGVRVGIHTGLVVIGDIGSGSSRQTGEVTGDTPALAARLESAADADTVLISAATHSLVADVFEFEPRRQMELKGFAEPVDTYRALGRARRPAPVRLPSDVRLTGRTRELAVLDRVWRDTERSAQAIAVLGEPGIGKSRLVRDFTASLGGDVAVVELVGSPELVASPYLPVVEHLLARAGDWTAPTTVVGALETCFDADLSPHARVLATLLTQRVSTDLPTDPGVAAERRRQETHEALAAALGAEMRLGPTVLVLEDAHWLDPSTILLAGELLERVADSQLLIALTARPTAQRQGTLGAAEELRLRPLNDAEAAQLVADIIGPGRAHLVDTVVDRAEGVPLFIEQFCLWLRNDLRAPDDTIPLSLQELLTARLAAVGGARASAQLAAVLGRAFDHGLLIALARETGLDAATVEAHLDELQRGGLVSPAGADGMLEFQHTLVRDAAYGTLLRSRRRELHGRVAALLRSDSPTGDVPPEQIAHHLAAAERHDEAAPQWIVAARHALSRGAHDEATSHLVTALDGIRSAEPTPRVTRREVDVLIALGSVRQATLGATHPEVAAINERLRAASLELDDDEARMRMLALVCGTQLTGNLYAEAHETASQLLDAADAVSWEPMVLWASLYRGMARLFQGRFSEANSDLRDVEARYDPALHETYVATSLMDPGFTGRSWAAHTAWHLGDRNGAFRIADDALAAAERTGHEFSIAFVATQSAQLFQRAGEVDRAARRAALGHDAGERAFSDQLVLQSRCVEGWVAAVRDGRRRGIQEIHDAIDSMRVLGARVMESAFLLMAADAALRMDEDELARSDLDAARSFAESSGERLHLAEIERLTGVLEVKAGRREHAERQLRHALSVAVSQHNVAYWGPIVRSLTTIVGVSDAEELIGAAKLAGCEV